MSDVQDALDFYAFLAQAEPDDSEHLTMCVIPGTPPSKSRVRFGKGNAYSRPEAVAAENRTAAFVRQALDGRRYLGNVALGCIFYRMNHQRVDADNMLKHICDAINGLAFKDDSQVTAIAARVELDKDNPRTVLVLGPHRSTLPRGLNDTTPCQRCGEPVSTISRRSIREPQRYCSKACQRAARLVDLSKPVVCGQCGQPFRKRTTYQTLCSSECRSARMKDSKKGRQRKLSNCTTCGKQLTHARGGRCRDCWRADAKINRPAAS